MARLMSAVYDQALADVLEAARAVAAEVPRSSPELVEAELELTAALDRLDAAAAR